MRTPRLTTWLGVVLFIIAAPFVILRILEVRRDGQSSYSRLRELTVLIAQNPEFKGVRIAKAKGVWRLYGWVETAESIDKLNAVVQKSQWDNVEIDVKQEKNAWGEVDGKP